MSQASLFPGSGTDNMRRPERSDRIHWELFPQFCEAETWAGGPDPQIAFILKFGADLRAKELVWLIGCYCAHHCVPSALAVFAHWPEPEKFLEDPGAGEWVAAHMKGLPVRPEMRHHRMPEKRAACLRGFAEYSLGWPYHYYREAEPYEAAWRHTIGSIPYYGRYMAIKFLEFLSRDLAPELTLGDLRPEGGWSPRRVLSWLFPRYSAQLNSEERSPAVRQLVNGSAEKLLEHIRRHHVPNLPWFALQVLLCEYREHWDGGFYPGCTHDEELLYFKQAEEVFGMEMFARAYQCRKEIFPEDVLGEAQGWQGIRKRCGRMLKERGAVWSDRVYRWPSMQPRNCAGSAGAA